mgnify:CR=1 FL=1
MKKSISVIFLILLMLSSTVFSPVGLADDSLTGFAIKRAKLINSKWVKYRDDLSVRDLATDSQIFNRVEALRYWSKELNYMYNIHHDRVFKDMLAFPEVETGWVNWQSKKGKDGNRTGVLDNGNSFGFLSIQWDTAKWIAKKNGWKYNETKLQNDVFLQAKFGVWYYYYQLQRKEDRITAMVAYNNPSVRTDSEKWRKYTMEMLGRVYYMDKLLNNKK